MVQDGQGVIRPTPKPVRLVTADTAVAVLDLTVRCDNPAQVCSLLIPGVSDLLRRARLAGVPVLFTGISLEYGTPGAAVATGLEQHPGEPLFFPLGYDKCSDPELKRFLDSRGVKNLVIVGSATNVAVMYTATSAARVHEYEVVIPIDGVNTRNPYEHEYALHQLCVIPGGAAAHIHFTTLSEIEFTSEP